MYGGRGSAKRPAPPQLGVVSHSLPACPADCVCTTHPAIVAAVERAIAACKAAEEYRRKARLAQAVETFTKAR